MFVFIIKHQDQQLVLLEEKVLKQINLLKDQEEYMLPNQIQKEKDFMVILITNQQ